MGFIAGYLLLNAFLVGLNLWGRFEAKRFLDAHSAIADAQALDAFKRMARRNMYAALVSLVMSSASVLWGLWIGWQIGLLGFAFVIAMMVIGIAYFSFLFAVTLAFP